MTPEQAEKRRRVMRRSMALGHCVCDPRLSCPCPPFVTDQVCHCAGETPSSPVSRSPLRLTEHVRAAGCASKISKRLLHDLLTDLPGLNDPRILVGSQTSDDAGVFLLNDASAAPLTTVLTVDVFTPVVDDPFTFGQIAAANSVSDIYAMGATPAAALSIVGYPVDTLPPEALRDILRGGAEKMREAGVPILGGHSLNDAEIKCGYAVIGIAPGGRFIRNSGAQRGDLLVLTKPLGGGLIAFAGQIGRATDAALAAVTRSMTALNRTAGEAMVRHHAHAATDITGFGFLGHLSEIARQSNVDMQITFDRLPLFPHARELAEADVLPGAVERNRESVPADLLDLASLTPGQQGLLFGPETSGGMLICLAAADAERLLDDLHRQHIAAACIIGQVTGPRPGGRIHVTSSTPCSCGGSDPRETPAPVAATSSDTPAGACCCSNGTDTPAADAALPAPACADAFRAYQAAINAPGALTLRQKKLMAIALSILSKCEPCVKLNVQAARDAGASDAEIAEAVAMGISFGGASAAMFYQKCRS